MLLKPGDVVAIVATARKISPQEIMPAVRLFESWGLDVIVPDGLFAVENQFAGSDAHRASILQQQLDDSKVKAIFCARGGYGTVRILDRLDLSGFMRHPKWIVGYSDVTALHSHIACCSQIPTIHAIMPINITDEAVAAASNPNRMPDAIESLRSFLFSGKTSISYSLDPEDGRFFCRRGRCEAPVVGGNLSVLYSLLGSESDISTDGKILLLEDVDEYLYHIDRMVMALKRAGKLSHLAGLVIGQFTDMHDNAVPFGRQASQIVFDAVSEYGYPVADCFPVGHVNLHNMAVPLNADALLDVSDNKILMTEWR